MTAAAATAERIVACLRSVHDRSIYLDCLRTQSGPRARPTGTDNNAGGTGAANVTHSSDLSSLYCDACVQKVQFCAITALSKGGKQPGEDGGIRTVKSLLLAQNRVSSVQGGSSGNRALREPRDGLSVDVRSPDKGEIGWRVGAADIHWWLCPANRN